MDSANIRSNKNKWAILFIVVMSTLMSALDSSIVNVALPVMSTDLNVASSSIQLVVTSYLITISATILVFGRLGDMIGKTKIFKFGIAVFTLGSLLCGITNSFPILVLARIIQAIGAGAVMANNQGIITEAFPPNERGRALGLNGTCVALGSLLGPSIGGFIVDAARWEYIFLINIPIGIITLAFAIKLLPKTTKTEREKLDGLGAVLFILFVVPLFAALGRAQEIGFTNTIILASFAVSIAAFIIFIIVEKRNQNPLLQLDIFKNKLFSLSIFCAFLSFIAIFCSNIIQPFYLQDARSFSPSIAGMVLMTYPMVIAVIAPISGYLSDKIGSEILTLIGLLLTSLGLFMMASLNENSPMAVIVLFTAVMALGNGLFQAPNNSLVMSTVSRDKLGIAGSVNALIRNLGMVSGIAISTTILYNRISHKIGYRVTDYVVGRDDAFIYGMRIVYIVAALICLVGVVLTALRLISKKGKSSILD